MSDEVTQQQAQLAAQQHEQIRSFATALARPDDDDCCQLIKGVVTAYAYPYLSVQVGGDTTTTIANVRHWESYSPVVGDTCQMIKQGSEIIAVARVNTNTASPALNGWVTPTLGSGFTAPLDVVRYRMVNDNGEKKIQLRGTLAVSGTPVNIWTMPADLRPVFTMTVLAGRDPGGGSNVVQIQIANTGGVSLLGSTVGVKASSGGPTGSRTNVDPGTASTSTSGVDIGHSHKFLNLDWGTTDGYRNADAFPYYWETSPGNGVPRSNHSHIVGQHQHALDVVTHPTSVSLNGIEFFL